MRHQILRRGVIAIKTALVLALLMGITALAFDVGYLALTKTQLQAACDSATLAGGTELFSGLGATPTAPAAVVTAAKAEAVTYAGLNPNGELAGSYVDPDNDVVLGWAVYKAGAWELHDNAQLPDVGGYNMIRVTLHRDNGASTSGDQPVSLFFARVLGRATSNLTVDATAVIVPANGITVTPGSDETSNAMPFALSKRLWEKHLIAQQYYAANGFPADFEAEPYYIDPKTGLPYVDAASGLPEPLFGHYTLDSHGDPEFQQDFYDDWSAGSCCSTDEISSITAGADYRLEMDVYPRDDFTSGNFGTIDIGSASNGTPEIVRQIVYGANDDDLAHYTNGTLTVPFITGGDTGLSVGIKSALDAVTGHCKAVFLTDEVTNPGNTATFSIVGMAGVRVMHSELTGALKFKHLSLQACDVTLEGGTGDYDDQIGVGDTVFTPLILIE